MRMGSGGVAVVRAGWGLLRTAGSAAGAGACSRRCLAFRRGWEAIFRSHEGASAGTTAPAKTGEPMEAYLVVWAQIAAQNALRMLDRRAHYACDLGQTVVENSARARA